MSDHIPGPRTPHIGTVGEKSLHAAIKSWYAQPGDAVELPVDGYVADIVRGDLLIEIQTRNFSAIRTKLSRLLDRHPVHLLHPIARDRWIVQQGKDGQPLGRRKSPKHGQILDLFNELVYIPDLLPHPNLTIEAILITEDEIRRESSRWSWRRRGWKLYDRQLIEIVGRASFQTMEDFLDLLPPSLPDQFTNRDLTAALACRYNLAQKITYTLRESGALTLSGKRGNTLVYEIAGRRDDTRP
jgi:hypothetical protein